MYKNILYEVNDSIASVTLNRPDYGNAFSADMYQEIIDVMTKIDQDEKIKVAVLTGAGKHFCTGGDVLLFQQMIDDERPITEEDVLKTGEMVTSVKKNSKPIIASINGAAAGAGLGLALACDFIMMGESSKLVTAFINMAFPGDTALVYNLQQAIGTFRTTRHMMLGEPIDATLAIEYGIAYSVTQDAHLKAATMQLASHLAAGPTQAYGQQKALIAEMLYPGLDEVNQKEAVFMNIASKSDDHRAAVNAFLKK